MVSMTTTTTHTTNTDDRPVVVIGASGKTGRRVVQRLAAKGVPVRAVSRSTAPSFDWHDESTWSAALAGAGAAYVTFQPDLAMPGSTAIIAAFGDAARDQGIERLVLLSGRGEPDAQACEQILLGSGVDTTVVRCSFFAQNFSEHFLIDAVVQGVIALPAGDVREPIVDADDIAEVATKALTEPGHAGKVYELTGPRLMSFAEVAADLSAATGREIVYLDVTSDVYVTEAIAAGVPPDEAEMLADLFAHIFDGHNESLATGVADVLGRPAKDFAEFAKEAAAAGAWS